MCVCVYVMIRRRAMNRKKAAQLLMEGKRSEARDCLAQCIDITPQMALELINVSSYQFDKYSSCTFILSRFYVHKTDYMR